MGITARTDQPSSNKVTANQRGITPKKSEPIARAKDTTPSSKPDQAEVKKEGPASPGGQTMAAGLAQNFGLQAGAKPDPGQAAVDEARKFLGSESQDLKGQLPNFDAAGGKTNNCADFVSANLMNQGLLQGKQVNVDRLQEQLKSEGWSSVDAADAKPGDVAFYKSKRHVELVSEAGGTKSIGSNNQDPNTREPVAGQQWITEREMDPSQVNYYTRP